MANEPLFCRVGVRVLAVGEESVIVAPISGGEAITLDKDTFRVFHAARHFRTMTAHAAAYQLASRTASSAKSYEAIEEKLKNLVRLELLLSNTAILKSEPDAPGAGGMITSVGIITKNRPLAVQRCVSSLQTNLRAHSRTVAVRVYDQSETDDTEKLIRSMAASADQLSIPLYYASAGDTRRFLDQLRSATNIAAEILDFAFTDLYSCGPTFGANLNNLLADTTGEIIIALDDDVICSPGKPLHATSKLVLSSEYDPTTVDLFTTRADALAAVTWVDIDLLSIHEQALGKRLSGCIEKALEDGGVDLSQVELSTGLFAQPDQATIAISMVGIAGDPGTYTASWCGLAERSPDLMRSEDAYLALHQSREAVRAVRELTITDNEFFMSACSGFDNRMLLPPFLPVFRNMEGPFATILRACFPGSAIAYAPFVVVHAPLATGIERKVERISLQLRFSELLMQAVKNANLAAWGADPKERMMSLGAYLMEIGRLSETAFDAWLRVQCYQHWAAQIVARQKLLKTVKDAPSSWSEEVRGDLVRLQDNMRMGIVTQLAEIPASSSSQQHMNTKSKTLIWQFGRLLSQWPVIQEACEFLHGKGEYIAEPICDRG